MISIKLLILCLIYCCYYVYSNAVDLQANSNDCPDPNCGVECEHGYLESEDKCKCNCKPNPCENHYCEKDYQKCIYNSYVYDGTTHTDIYCSPHCPPLDCLGECTGHLYFELLGRVYCPTCQCIYDPCDQAECGEGLICVTKDTKEEPYVCVDPITSDECSIKDCQLNCSIGYKMKSEGCPVCECIEDPCELEKNTDCGIRGKCVATIELPYMNEQMIRYKAVWQSACPICNNLCDNGYIYDDEGCSTCACLDHACNSADCVEGNSCVLNENDNTQYKCVETSSIKSEIPNCDFSYGQIGYAFVNNRGVKICQTIPHACKNYSCESSTDLMNKDGCSRFSSRGPHGVIIRKFYASWESECKTCVKYCEHGYVNNGNKCHECRCKEDTCQKIPCGEGLKCFSETPGIYECK